MNQNDISKGHTINQNDISKKDNVLRGLLRNSAEQDIFIVLKKIEKIVTGIHMVANVMDEHNALTDMIRNRSLGVLTSGYSLLSTAPSHERSIMSVIIQLQEISSLIHIGNIGNHISVMNADIIRYAIDDTITVLSDIAQKARRNFGGSLLLIEEQTDILSRDVLRDESFDELTARIQSKRHQNDIKTTLLEQKDISKNQNDIKTTFQNDIVNNKDKIDRKKEIIDALKSQQPATLQDIKKLIKNLSDKTIQRELNGLIDMGVVSREGNKRWTVYRLVQQK